MLETGEVSVYSVRLSGEALVGMLTAAKHAGAHLLSTLVPRLNLLPW